MNRHSLTPTRRAENAVGLILSILLTIAVLFTLLELLHPSGRTRAEEPAPPVTVVDERGPYIPGDPVADSLGETCRELSPGLWYTTGPVPLPCGPTALVPPYTHVVDPITGCTPAVPSTSCPWDPDAEAQHRTAPTTYDDGICHEDEPCWDCTTMGNRICGSTTTTILPTSEPPETTWPTESTSPSTSPGSSLAPPVTENPPLTSLSPSTSSPTSSAAPTSSPTSLPPTTTSPAPSSSVSVAPPPVPPTTGPVRSLPETGTTSTALAVALLVSFAGVALIALARRNPGSMW